MHADRHCTVFTSTVTLPAPADVDKYLLGVNSSVNVATALPCGRLSYYHNAQANYGDAVMKVCTTVANG